MPWPKAWRETEPLIGGRPFIGALHRKAPCDFLLTSAMASSSFVWSTVQAIAARQGLLLQWRHAMQAFLSVRLVVCMIYATREGTCTCTCVVKLAFQCEVVWLFL